MLRIDKKTREQRKKELRGIIKDEGWRELLIEQIIGRGFAEEGDPFYDKIRSLPYHPDKGFLELLTELYLSVLEHVCDSCIHNPEWRTGKEKLRKRRKYTCIYPEMREEFSRTLGLNTVTTSVISSSSPPEWLDTEKNICRNYKDIVYFIFRYQLESNL